MDNCLAVWPQWEIVEEIGRGSFGSVYKVKREQMGNVFYAAVKIIRVPQNRNEARDLESSGMDADSINAYFSEMVKNLLNEIRVMESLKSANNIVAIEDFEVLPVEGMVAWDIYIRMELLTDLGTYLNQHEMTENEIVKLGVDIAQALEICENSGIIHRDIKIDNVFINRFGTFKLGDFGISKQLDKTQSALSQKGTNMYMAPEVFRGEKYNNTVDIYSLGILLYRLLNSGRFPFMPPKGTIIHYEDSEKAMQRRINGEKIPDIEGVPKELMRIISKMCSYSPSERYSSASEVKTELTKYHANDHTNDHTEKRDNYYSKKTDNNHEDRTNYSNEYNDGKTYSAFSDDFTAAKREEANKQTVKRRYCISCGREIPVGVERCPICYLVKTEKKDTLKDDSLFSDGAEVKNNSKSAESVYSHSSNGVKYCTKCGIKIPYGDHCLVCGPLKKESKKTNESVKSLCDVCGSAIPQGLNNCPICNGNPNWNNYSKPYIYSRPNTNRYSEPQRSDKNANLASALAFFLGDIGIHNYYLGRYRLGMIESFIFAIGFFSYLAALSNILDEISLGFGTIVLGIMRGLAVADFVLISEGWRNDSNGRIVCTEKVYNKIKNNPKRPDKWWKAPGTVIIVFFLSLLFFGGTMSYLNDGVKNNAESANQVYYETTDRNVKNKKEMSTKSDDLLKGVVYELA